MNPLIFESWARELFERCGGRLFDRWGEVTFNHGKWSRSFTGGVKWFPRGWGEVTFWYVMQGEVTHFLRGKDFEWDEVSSLGWGEVVDFLRDGEIFGQHTLAHFADVNWDNLGSLADFRSNPNTLLQFILLRKIQHSVLAFERPDAYQKRRLPPAHIMWWMNYDIDDVAAIEKVAKVWIPRDCPFQGDSNLTLTCESWAVIQNCQMEKHSKGCLTLWICVDLDIPSLSQSVAQKAAI
jgi:hypothetical protein